MFLMGLLLLAVLIWYFSWLSMGGSFRAEERDVTPHTDVVISYLYMTNGIMYFTELMVLLVASLYESEYRKSLSSLERAQAY